MANRKQVQEMADRLISTLNGSIDNEKADAIVRDVAEELYRDVLGLPGQVVIDTDKPYARAHIGGTRGVKKQAVMIAEYTYRLDKTPGSGN